MTDQPEAFDGWPITVLSLSEETLGISAGAGGYSHRRKACAIQAGVMLAGKTIFIGYRYGFFQRPRLLFKRVTDDQFLMDEFELSWAQASRRAWYRPLVTLLDAEFIAPAPALRLFNSGVCGMTNANGHIVEGAISLIDQWAHLGARILTIEQIALSFMLYGRRVVEANDCINHYYAVKRYHHAMYRTFSMSRAKAIAMTCQRLHLLFLTSSKKPAARSLAVEMEIHAARCCTAQGCKILSVG